MSSQTGMTSSTTNSKKLQGQGSPPPPPIKPGYMCSRISNGVPEQQKMAVVEE